MNEGVQMDGIKKELNAMVWMCKQRFFLLLLLEMVDIRLGHYQISSFLPEHNGGSPSPGILSAQLTMEGIKDWFERTLVLAGWAD